MRHDIQLEQHPLFEKDIFKNHPDLFAPFFRNTQAHLQRKYEARRQALDQYENTVQWPLIVGPGFSGATHPGAGKTFHGLMTGSSCPIYDSDCLYVRPSEHIFAIADAPGISTYPRNLFKGLDDGLRGNSPAELEALINHLNGETTITDRTTLTLLSLHRDEPGGKFQKALAFIAGDTCLFHGNIHRGELLHIPGNFSFLGRMTGHLAPITFHLEEGDFFVIASDGISAVRSSRNKLKIEKILWDHMQGNLQQFVHRVIQRCNRLKTERSPHGPRAWFCGNDDITVLIVYPEKLSDMPSTKGIILGGYTR